MSIICACTSEELALEGETPVDVVLSNMTVESGREELEEAAVVLSGNILTRGVVTGID